MKLLGIDYGTKRIGVAISDENATLAFPKMIILNDINALKHLGEILEKENISEIVVGESEDFSGKLNPISEKIEIFISELKDKFKLPIHKQKEFWTSVEARRFQGSGKAVDASAAALILQRYLDKKQRNII